MSRIFLVGCWILLLICGCSTSRHTRSTGAGPHIQLSKTDAAVVEALLYRLSETRAETSELRKKKGTLFLCWISQDAVNAVVAHLGRESPCIETNCKYIDDFRDSRSGKGSRIMRVSVRSETAESALLWIGDRGPSLLGVGLVIELRWVNGTWRVVSSRITEVE